MNIVDKKIEEITAEKQRLTSYVKEAVAKIGIPDSAVTTKIVKRPQNNTIEAGGMVAGLVVLGIGLAINNSTLSTIGGVVAAGSAGLYAKKAMNPKVSEVRDVKYYEVTRSYNKDFSDIFKAVTEQWDNFLTDRKRELKAEIMRCGISEEQKNKAIQSILTSSVINLSLMDVSSHLNEVEKTKDKNEYDKMAKSFQTDCIAAIEQAYNEQRAIYETLRKYL